jgi:hypothetical protein
MKSNIKIFLLCILGLTLILSASISRADITGSISGVITDPSGAVIPGATVTAIAISTNIQHAAVTDSKGFYSFPALNVDHYDVSARQASATFLRRASPSTPTPRSVSISRCSLAKWRIP